MKEIHRQLQAENAEMLVGGFAVEKRESQSLSVVFFVEYEHIPLKFLGEWSDSPSNDFAEVILDESLYHSSRKIF